VDRVKTPLPAKAASASSSGGFIAEASLTLNI
jgi:hypothetical protein